MHLPVALGRRGGREALGGGRCAVAQRMPRSRALRAHRGPPLVCISAARLWQCTASEREERRVKLDHVRSLLPVQCPAQGTFQQGQSRREGVWSQPSFSAREAQAPGRLQEQGEEQTSLSTAAPWPAVPGGRSRRPHFMEWF